MQTGLYRIYGAKIDALDDGQPRDLVAGRYLSVGPHTGALEWLRPDGVREPIPTIYLYPPLSLARGL